MLRDHGLHLAQRAIQHYAEFCADICGRFRRQLRSKKLATLVEEVRESRKERDARLRRSLITSRQLITSYSKSPAHRYDILRIGRYAPREEQLSDIFASLLDPTAGHGLGNEPLLGVLQSLGKQERSRAATTKILELLPSADLRIFREYPAGASITDIAIVSDHFAIFIENKKRWGSETVTDQGWQIPRQGDELEELRAMGKAVLGIYLSPNGAAAVHPLFSVFTYRDLSRVVREALKRRVEGDGRNWESLSNLGSIWGLLNYIDWE